MSNLAIIQENLSTELIAAGIESVLPESVKIQTFVRCAAVAMASNKDLGDASRESVIMSLTQCAKDGLIPDNKEAALVTFNTKVKHKDKPDEWVKKAQYLPMIDGVMKRARMSGQLAILSSKAVFNDDIFRYWMDENGEHLNYEPTYQGGDIRLCFAFAKLTTGELIVEVMSKADIDKVRAASKTGTYGPWADWYDRMGCKTVMHRLAKRLPNASEIIEMCEQGMNMSFDKNSDKNILTAEKEINPQAYSSDLFDKNYPAWSKQIADGKKTPVQIIAFLGKKGITLTQEQELSLKEIGVTA